MTKEEFKAKLRNCELRLEDVAKAIEEVKQELLAKAEKPKLRHGAWWFDEGDKAVNVFLKEFNTDERDCVANPRNLYTNIGSSYDGEPILGNVFDLMKGWSEDSYRANIDGFVIEICGDKIVIGGRRFRIKHATEFWHKLGQLIATFKRKENKCS